MPHSTFVEMPEEEQAQMLAALRRARYGYLLARHGPPDGDCRRPVLLALQCLSYRARLSGGHARLGARR